jgi:phage-related minor tail protein
MKLHAIIVFFLSLLITAGPAVAQTATQKEDKEKNQRYLYEWMDGNGTVHISDDLGDVPEQYRRQVRKRLDQPAKEETGRQEQVAPQPEQQSEEETDQEAGKEEWQQRIRDWKGRLAGAEKRYQALEEERGRIILRSGVPAAALPGDPTRVIEIEGEIKKTQKEIDDARNMINVVIPEEARKAGIPPGWLRE